MKWFAILAILMLAMTACSQKTAPAGNTMQKEEPVMEKKDDSKASELKDIFGKMGLATYKVSYDLKMQSGKTATTSKLTQYIKGDKLRMDTMASGVESRTYMTDKLYTCTKQQGDWLCLSIDSGNTEQSESETVQEAVKQDPEQYDVTYLGKRTIAGTSAECYGIKETDEFDVEYCFSSDFVPLYVKSAGTSGDETYSSEMTATSYSKSVPDSDFTLPAKAQSMDELYKDIPSGYDVPTDYGIPDY